MTTNPALPVAPEAVQVDQAPKGLGRRHAPDVRDLAFPIRAMIPKKFPADLRPYRYWNGNSWWGDQGNRPHCVAFAGVKWLEDGPVTYDGPHPDPAMLYRVCQQHDEWPGEAYDGTSVRALARVLSDPELAQAAGIDTAIPLILEYRWAFDVVDLVWSVLTMGPAVMGTNWPWSYFRPNADGFVTIDGRGYAGGHAWKVSGAKLVAARGQTLQIADPNTWDMARSFLRADNSWGRDWGKKGHFYVPLDQAARLIHEDGEAMVAVENPDLVTSAP